MCVTPSQEQREEATQSGEVLQREQNEQLV